MNLFAFSPLLLLQVPQGSQENSIESSSQLNLQDASEKSFNNSLKTSHPVNPQKLTYLPSEAARVVSSNVSSKLRPLEICTLGSSPFHKRQLTTPT